MMIDREAEAAIRQTLTDTAAVVLLGPRQVGKTTLAQAVVAGRSDAVMLDFERESDRASLSGILCVRHSMTSRSMYAKQEDDEGGCGRGGAYAVHSQGTH